MAKILSKFDEQQLVMVNYACGFNQSETGKYFEWIIMEIIIQLSYSVGITIFWLADLYHVILSCDETTSLTSLSWCKSRVVNSTHTIVITPWLRLTQTLTSVFCSVFNLNNQNVNTLIAREFSIGIYLHSFTNNGLTRDFNCKFIVSELVQVYPDNSLSQCVTL